LTETEGTIIFMERIKAKRVFIIKKNRWAVPGFAGGRAMEAVAWRDYTPTGGWERMQV
jgi:hypothetical protein